MNVSGLSLSMPDAPPNAAKGRSMSQRQSKRILKRHVIEMQESVRADILDPLTDKNEKSALIRAWDVLAERLRVLSGQIKAGSRNVSVKEEAKKTRKQVVAPMDLAQAAEELGISAVDEAKQA